MSDRRRACGFVRAAKNPFLRLLRLQSPARRRFCVTEAAAAHTRGRFGSAFQRRLQTAICQQLPILYKRGPQRPKRPMSAREGGCTLFRTRLHAYAAFDDKFEHSHLISAREELLSSGGQAP